MVRGIVENVKAVHPYELVDTSTGNWLGFHRTKQEAFEAVVEMADRWGEGAVVNVALGHFPPGKPGKAIAEGPALLALARSAMEHGGPEPASARRRVQTKPGSG
jgi:hypothetical protein